MLQQMGIKLVKKKTALKIVVISSRKQHNCLSEIKFGIKTAFN